ncbi:hypothetical protein M9H77_30182 [Catharanthus roseus]|uniref:Uncharacterized protein n=1 Tax=Catharanthus roseus TaxID=4058 RepID=A0ACB9ZXK3_CATRO|nr:hypothetical protein M9H77_30182 [Catharanthus roseus]
MGAKPIKTWSLMKQALRNRFGVVNNEGQGQEVSEEEEQREEEIVVLEKSEELNFYANETNSSFASESFGVLNFEDSSKDKGGKLAYKSIKTINFFPSNSYSRVEDKGRSMEKELGNYLEGLIMSPFLNPSLSFHEVSFEELKSSFDCSLDFTPSQITSFYEEPLLKIL